jgi:fibronectin-binding autotransporter adhesin
VSLESGESLKGRIGLALGHDSLVTGESRTHVYALANLTHEFLGEQSVDVAGVNIAFEPQKFGGKLGLGGTYEWAGGKYALHGEALGQTSFEGSYGVKGAVGFSTRF